MTTADVIGTTVPSPARPSGRRAPVAAMVVVYVVATGLAATSIVGRLGGRFVFAIDDPYIHFALADELLESGTWGLEPGRYESASSAPLWTAGLAGVRALTRLPLPAVALAAAMAASIWFVWLLAGVVAPLWQRGTWLLRGALAALPLAIGLPVLTLLGMEHALHLALLAQALVLLAQVLGEELTRGRLVVLAAVLALASLVRFETLFFGAAVVGALALVPDGGALGLWSPARRRLAAVVTAAVAVPAVVYAAVNLALGGYLLPNSVIAKGDPDADVVARAGDALENAVRDPLVTLLAAAAVWLAIRRWRSDRPHVVVPLVAVAATAGCFLVFGRTESLFRYSGFVLGLLALVLLASLADDPPALPNPTVVAAAIVLLTLPRLVLLTWVPASATGIHDQQYQTARFLDRHHDDEAVVLNDIGFPGWRHDGPLIDVAGLGSADVLRELRSGDLDADYLDDVASERHATVALLFDRFYGAVVPATWTPVRTWCLEGTVVTNSDRCVTWYATDGGDPADLRRELERFERELPSRVAAREPET